MAPVDKALDDLIVRLEEDGAVPEVVEEGLDGGLHVEAVEPEREDTSFSLALRVEIFHLQLLLLRDGIEGGVRVEEVRDKGEVELRVTGDERGGVRNLRQPSLSACDENLLRPLQEIPGLEGSPRWHRTRIQSEPGEPCSSRRP